MPDPRHDATLYGRSFADVYDEWYPEDDHSRATVTFLTRQVDQGDSVLELGVGTGRVAIPLAERGLDVTGMDSSAEMLDRLRERAGGRVAAVLGDVADPRAWPDGPFDLVVAAFNLICNIVDPELQAGVFSTAAGVLAPGGRLVIEADELDDDAGPSDAPATGLEPSDASHLELRELTVDSVVLIATQLDGASRVVTGQHVELRDGVAPRLRPWRVRLSSTQELDGWARAAGLELAERRRGWAGRSSTTLSCYRRR